MSTADLNKIVNAFTVYKFIKAITMPFELMDAYKLGIIDRHGTFLKKTHELKTSQEREASSIFDRLIINIKKIFALVPDTRIRSMLTTLPTATFLVKEDIESLGGDGQEFEEFIKEFLGKEGIDVEQELTEEAFGNAMKTEYNNCVGYAFGVPIYKYNDSYFSQIEGD
jgi:hypothetical protein